ncbi:unnamed protein product [Penicillium palitans]
MPKIPSALSVGLSLAIPVAIPVLLSASRPLSAKDAIAILKRIKDVTLAVLEVVIAVTKVLKKIEKGLKIIKRVIILAEELGDLFQWGQWIQWAETLRRQWNNRSLLITLPFPQEQYKNLSFHD